MSNPESKIVYAYDPTSRVYLGEHHLDASDKCQFTGDWLVPGNCLEQAPPTIGENQYALATGNGWELCEPDPVPVMPVKDEVVEPGPPTTEQKLAELEQGLQHQLEALAHSYGYSSLDKAISYADEISVAKFYAEGREFRRLRSLAEAAFYDLSDKVLAGKSELPASLEALMELLPWIDTIRIEEARKSTQASLDAIAIAAAKIGS